MAGKIIADTIEASGSQISLNVGNTTILTASSTGLTLIPTTNVNVNLTNSIVNLTSGNVTNPSLTFSGNTSTGIYMPAANTIAFTTAGTEDMRITSAGNVGIGTSSPSYKLDVTSSVRLGDGTGQVIARINGANSGTNNGAAVYFQNAGTTNFAVGNYSAIAGGAYSADALYYLGNANNHIWFVSGSEKMRIDSSGNLLVGTTSQFFSGKQCIYFDGNSLAGLSLQTSRATTGSTYVYFVNSASAGTGSISQNGTNTVAYGTSSDYRLKENIAPMTGALDTVAQLKPVTYKWKADGSDGQGFIAHELQEVVPDCVIGEKDDVDAEGNPAYQNVDTSFLVATLTAAIQELKAIVDAQAVEIAALKAK